MQIWRMHPDGSNQEQVITGETNGWLPHISPDAKWMTFLSYQKGVTGHPTEKEKTSPYSAAGFDLIAVGMDCGILLGGFKAARAEVA
jgi:hypothetical protein